VAPYFMLVLSVAFGVAVSGGSTGVAAAPAPGAVTMAGQLWLIKDNDLAVLGGMGSYQWVGCGMTTAPLTIDNFTPCSPGEDPIYTNYATFVADVASHALVPGDTVIFDNETWCYTPAWERANQGKYEKLAAQLAAANGITFIDTPAAQNGFETIVDDVAAARYASVVDIQAQARDRDPTSYVAFVRKAVAAIRAVNPSIPILAGLATDPLGRPTTVAHLVQDYQGVRDLVQGFWMNADTWAAPRGHGCAPLGCPQIGRQFLAAIGVASPS